LCHYQYGNITLYQHPDQADQEIMELFQDESGRIAFSNLSGQVFGIIDGKVLPLLDDPVYSANYIYFQFGYLWTLGRKLNQWELRIYQLNAKARFQSPALVHTRLLPTGGCAGFRKLDKEHVLIAARNVAPPVLLNARFPLQSPLVTNAITKLSQQFRSTYSHNLIWQEDWVYLNAQQQLWYKQSPFYRLPEVEVNQIKVLDNNLYVLTKRGMHLFPPSSAGAKRISIFPDWHINDVIKDKYSRLWIGTTQGLAIVPDLGALLFQQQFGGLPDNQVLATASLGKQKLLCSTDEASIVEVNYNGSSGRVYHSSGGNIKQLIPATAPGEFWCVAENGMFLFDANSWQLKESILTTGNIKTVYADSATAAVGTSFGIYLLRGPAVKPKLSLRYEIPKRVYALLPWRNDQWLAGTEKGLWKVTLQNPPGCMPELLSDHGQINKIVKDHQGHIWVATTSHGVLHFDHQLTLLNSTLVQQQYGKRISDLAVDSDGLLWLLSEKGLYGIIPGTGRVNHFLPPDQYYVGESANLLLQGAGLWLGGAHGLVALPERSRIPSEYKEFTIIHKFSVNNQNHPPGAVNDLEPHENNLLFTFAKEGLVGQKQGGFEYKIEGVNTEWQYLPNSELQLYLPQPGFYKLLVRAATVPGIRASNIASIAFTIRTPWYKTWWFYTTVLLSIIGVTALGVYYWQQMKNKALEKERNLQEKMAELQQQALRAQLNPHFIFNALNSISQFISANEERQALHYLSRFSKLIRAVLEASRKKTILLEQELELLEHYLELERLRYQGDVDIRLELANEVKEQIHSLWVPPMLYQPIIENSLKHGLNNKSAGHKYLGISFYLEYPYLVCAIEDNGVGREAASRLAKWNTSAHQSSGMTMTTERLSALGQSDVTTTHQPVMITEDLKDAEGQPSGTRTIIKIVV
jgi:ligand-binding sensor domain-containing protein